MCTDKRYKEFITYSDVLGMKGLRYTHSVSYNSCGSIYANVEITEIAFGFTQKRSTVDFDLNIYKGALPDTRTTKIESMIESLKKSVNENVVLFNFQAFEGEWDEGGCISSDGFYVTLNDCYRSVTFPVDEFVIDKIINCLEKLKEDITLVYKSNKINWNYC